MNQREILTPPELADYLGVPISTLKYWRMHRTGPPALRMANGKHIRYRLTDVDQWLSNQAVEHPVHRRRRKAG